VKQLNCSFQTKSQDMSNSSFVNGLIAGAGIVLAIMSVGFLYFIAPIENQQGVSSTEIRVAIMLGGIVAAVSIGYEYYLNKNNSKSTKQEDTDKIKAESEKAAQEAKDAVKVAEEAEAAAKEAIAKAAAAKAAQEAEDAVKAAEEAEAAAKVAIAKAAAAKAAESNLNKKLQQVDSITESQETDAKDETR